MQLNPSNPDGTLMFSGSPYPFGLDPVSTTSRKIALLCRISQILNKNILNFTAMADISEQNHVSGLLQNEDLSHLRCVSNDFWCPA